MDDADGASGTSCVTDTGSLAFFCPACCLSWRRLNIMTSSDVSPLYPCGSATAGFFAEHDFHTHKSEFSLHKYPISNIITMVNAAAIRILRVATNSTANSKNLRTMGVLRNFSCSLLISSDKKRPPTFSNNIMRPMKYGLELILVTKTSRGFAIAIV